MRNFSYLISRFLNADLSTKCPNSRFLTQIQAQNFQILVFLTQIQAQNLQIVVF
jgi:hypothetical protein